MPKQPTYTHEDVMQAVCAALSFGEDAGYEALGSMQDEAAGRVEPSTYVTRLDLKAGRDVCMSTAARDILALAYSELGTRGVHTRSATGIRRYDFRSEA